MEEPTTAEQLSQFSKEELIVRIQGLEEENRKLKHEKGRLSEKNGHLESLSITDQLTGVKNRRGFDQALELQFALAKRYGRTFSVAFIDLDKFKELNAKYGRPKADEALTLFAGFLEKNFRTADIVTRWGGDEFVAILPETDASGALGSISKLFEKIPVWEGNLIKFSCGIVEYSRTTHDTSKKMVDDASEACEKAKTLPDTINRFVLASNL